MSIFGDGHISTHANPTHGQMARVHARIACAMAAHHSARDVCDLSEPVCPSRFVQFWASGGAKFPKIADSVPWMPINHSAKFDATSFILSR